MVLKHQAEPSRSCSPLGIWCVWVWWHILGQELRRTKAHFGYSQILLPHFSTLLCSRKEELGGSVKSGQWEQQRREEVEKPADSVFTLLVFSLQGCHESAVSLTQKSWSLSLPLQIQGDHGAHYYQSWGTTHSFPAFFLQPSLPFVTHSSIQEPCLIDGQKYSVNPTLHIQTWDLEWNLLNQLESWLEAEVFR